MLGKFFRCRYFIKAYLANKTKYVTKPRVWKCSGFLGIAQNGKLDTNKSYTDTE